MSIAIEAVRTLPTRSVCRALDLPKASYYRLRAPRADALSFKDAFEKRSHPRALSTAEKQEVLDVLHADRFVDMAPAAVCATLIDEGRYLCSTRTMYRILKAKGEVRERRAVASHPPRTPPQLVANAPNQVWTWDITHLPTSVKGVALRLYVCLDLFSRFVVGWYLSTTESSAEAKHLFGTLAQREGIDRDQLVVHADNGGPMRGWPLADLLESLGIERSHSRPNTSNDNPFSESQFKTLKYRPTYPRRFESIDHARAWCGEFFDWYNQEHRHEGIALLTPADVYTGRAPAKLAARAQTLAAAYAQHPNRFVKGHPKPKNLPHEVAINPPPQPLAPHTTAEATQLQEVAK